MAVLVLLRNAEVHVEQEVASHRRSLRRAAVENLSQPLGMNEALVVRETLDRQAIVCSPDDPLLVRSDVVEPDLGEPRAQPVHLTGVGPIEDERRIGSHTLDGQKSRRSSSVRALNHVLGSDTAPGR